MPFALVMPLTPTEIASLLDVADRAARLHEQPGATESLRQNLRALMAHVGDVLRSAGEVPDPTLASVAAPPLTPSAVTVTPDDDGGFTCTGPNGAVTQGDTLPEALRNLAEAVEVSAESFVAKVGDVLHRWSDVPPGTLVRDKGGDVDHKRTDKQVRYWWPRPSGKRKPGWLSEDYTDEEADCGPWTVLALGVSDDVTGDEVARLVGDA